MSNPSELPALAELGERLEAARQARRRKPSNPLLRPAWLVPAVLVAMVGLAFTPPGRTLTGEVGELVGIGEVGGPPTQPSKVGDFDPATGQVILAVGEAADGAQFEIVAYRAKQDATCVNVEFLDAPPDRAGVCYSGALN